jgi:DNA ligase-1
MLAEPLFPALPATPAATRCFWTPAAAEGHPTRVPAVDPLRRAFALAFLAGPWAGGGAMAAAARDPAPLQLAREAPADIDPRGWLVSEKLDGARAWWDGKQLRFRSGIPIQAPAWFTQRLPRTPLDGELWLGRGCFEDLVGAVRRQTPDDAAWRELRYQVFDLPGAPGPFEQRAARLRALVERADWAGLEAVEQRVVPDRAALRAWLDHVVEGGGEGLMLHRAQALWRPGRSPDLLKLKTSQDDEAVVIGHVPGRGRLAGQLGALRVRDAQGREFLLGTGMDDAFRRNPPPVGSLVSYTYQGRTGQGLPRFASYLRERPAF